MPELGINEDGLKRLRDLYKGELDTDKLLAQKLGVSHASINRVRNGKQDPGSKLINRVWKVLGPQWVTDLFKPL